MRGDIVLLVLAMMMLALACWLAVLTAVVRRRVRYEGEPVFRRLRGGRTRFTWSVAQDYGRARRVSVDVPTAPMRTGSRRTGA